MRGASYCIEPKLSQGAARSGISARCIIATRPSHYATQRTINSFFPLVYCGSGNSELSVIMLRLLILRLATTLATRALADGHGGKLLGGVGAFVTLMVQAIDPDALIELMKKNTILSKALRSSVAGV